MNISMEETQVSRRALFNYFLIFVYFFYNFNFSTENLGGPERGPERGPEGGPDGVQMGVHVLYRPTKFCSCF